MSPRNTTSKETLLSSCGVTPNADADHGFQNHMIYRMRNSPSSYGGFGDILRFQEQIGKQLAQHHDQHYCVGGPHDTHPIVTLCNGYGKSAVLSNGVKLLQTFCGDSKGQKLFTTNAPPLEIHISFGKCSEFALEEKKASVALATNRRIVANYLGLSWEDGCKLPLDEGLSISTCLEAIVEHHRNIAQLSTQDLLLVYLAIDDFAKVPSDQNNSATIVLQQVQQVMLHNSVLSVVFAGAVASPFRDICQQLHIDLLELRTHMVSDEQIETILRYDVGLSECYLRHPSFRALLTDLGSHLPLIGIAVSMLEFEFDPESIQASRRAVEEYVRRNTKDLTSSEAAELLALAIGGIKVNPSHQIGDDSQLTVEALELTGAVAVVPSNNASLGTVYLPRVFIDEILRRNPLSGYYTDATKRLLYFVDRLWDTAHVSMFIAHYLGMKRNYFFQRASSVSIDKLLPTSDDQSIVLPRLQQSLEHQRCECTNGVLKWRGSPFPEVDSRTVQKLLNGGRIVVNTNESLININMATAEGSSRGLFSILVDFSLTHPDQPLLKGEIESRLTKAVEAAKRSSSCYSSIVPAVITNRPIGSDALNHMALATNASDSRYGQALFIGKQNMNQVLGPTMGRLLTSRWASFGSTGKASCSTLKTCFALRSRMKML